MGQIKVRDDKTAEHRDQMIRYRQTNIRQSDYPSHVTQMLKPGYLLSYQTYEGVSKSFRTES
jgi:hypothetical protein